MLVCFMLNPLLIMYNKGREALMVCLVILLFILMNYFFNFLNILLQFYDKVMQIYENQCLFYVLETVAFI